MKWSATAWPRFSTFLENALVKVAYKGGRLLISGRPYEGVGMDTAKRKQNQSLVQKHRKLFKQPDFLRPDSESLEQPYAGEVVETITTYSLYGEQSAEE